MLSFSPLLSRRDLPLRNANLTLLVLLRTEFHRRNERLFSSIVRRGPKDHLEHVANYLIEERSPKYSPESDGDVDTWARGIVDDFFAARKSVEPEPAPSGAAASAAPEKKKCKLWSNFLTRRIIQYLCHSWAEGDGAHAAWVDADDLRYRVRDKLELDYVPALNTARDWLRKEMEVRRRFCPRTAIFHPTTHDCRHFQPCRAASSRRRSCLF